MKKFLGIAFVVMAMTTFGAENLTTIDKQVTGVNKERLSQDKIENNIELKNQNITNKEIIENDVYKTEKIGVIEGEKDILEDEISQSVEKKSYLKYILGGIGVVALIVAL